MKECLLADARAKVKKEKPTSNNPKPETLARIDAEYDIKLEQAEHQALDKCALSPLTGRVCCIGLSIQHPVTNDWQDLVATAETADEEPGLLKWLDEQMSGWGERSPLLVTYNGRKFDLPFLAARAMVLDLSMKSKLPLGYTKTWDSQSPAHVDIFDWLGQGKQIEWVFTALGAGEVQGFSGADVQAAADSGDWDSIRDHCRADIVEARKLWCRLRNIVHW